VGNRTKSRPWLIPTIAAVATAIVGALILFGASARGCRGLEKADSDGNSSLWGEATKEFYLKIRAQKTKTSGKDWDSDGSAPDMAGTVEADGEFVGRVDKRQDKYAFKAGPFHIDDLGSVSELKVCLKDTDLRFHDNMGCVIIEDMENGQKRKNENFVVELVY